MVKTILRSPFLVGLWPVLGFFSFCLPAQSAFALKNDTYFSGKFCELIESDYSRGREKSTFTLYDGDLTSKSYKNRKTVIFRFLHSRPLKKLIPCGANVVFLGEVAPSGRIIADPATIALINVGASSAGHSGSSTSLTNPAPPSGDQRTLVMVLDFLNTNVPALTSSIEASVFTDALSVNALYQEASNGRISFSGQVLRYTISADLGTGVCDHYGWAYAAEAMAENDGYDLSQYPRRLFILPSAANCGWGGLGTAGGNPSRAWVRYGFNTVSNVPSIATHEFGHNLGLHHAASFDYQGEDCGFYYPHCVSEYGDDSDPMGTPINSSIFPLGLVGFNAPHKDEFGWVDAIELTDDILASISALNQSPDLAPFPQVYKVIKPNTSDSDAADWYYLSYRNSSGFDGLEPSGFFRNSLSLHSFRGGYRHSYLFGFFQDSALYQDAANEYNLNMLSHDDTSAIISLDYTPKPVSPLVITDVWVQIGNLGVTKTYAFTVTNMDHPQSTESTFNFSVSAPNGWTINLSSSNLTLEPRKAGTLLIDVTPPDSAPNNYTGLILNVTDSAEPAHSAAPRFGYIVDSAAPTVSVDSPTDGAIFPRRGNITVECLASDGVGLSAGNTYINDILAYSISFSPELPRSTSWSTSFPNGNFAFGANTIRCQALDYGGNTAEDVITIFRSYHNIRLR